MTPNSPEPEVLVGLSSVRRRVDANLLQVWPGACALLQGIAEQSSSDATSLKTRFHEEQGHVLVIPNLDHSSKLASIHRDEAEMSCPTAKQECAWLDVVQELPTAFFRVRSASERAEHASNKRMHRVFFTSLYGPIDALVGPSSPDWPASSTALTSIPLSKSPPSGGSEHAAV